jgi:hypothetical protein
MSNKGQDYARALNFISDQVSFYYLAISTPIGLVGNLVSILVYLRLNLKKRTSTNSLFLSLTVINTLSILNYVFMARPQVLFRYSVITTCGLANYFQRTIFNMTAWCQVLICLDRFMMVSAPSKFKLLQKSKYLAVQMIIILAFVLITNFTNLVTYL